MHAQTVIVVFTVANIIIANYANKNHDINEQMIKICMFSPIKMQMIPLKMYEIEDDKNRHKQHKKCQR